MANVWIDENTMTAIGDAIRGKTGKGELMLPADMPTEIGAIDLNKGIKSLIDGSITTFTWPDDITKIRDYAFYGCEDLNINQGDMIDFSNVTDIGKFAFANCTALGEPTEGKSNKVINFSKALKNVGEKAFLNCTSIGEVWNIGGNIASDAFEGCHIKTFSGAATSSLNPLAPPPGFPWGNDPDANAEWVQTGGEIMPDPFE